MIYNSRSIGVERIVTKDAGVDALYNQAKLIASLMYMENIPLHRVITHFDACYARRLPLKDKLGNLMYDENGEVVYNIKSCPDRLIHGQYGGLLAFRQVIVNCLRKGDLYLNQLEILKSKIKESDERQLKLQHLHELKDLVALRKMDDTCKKLILK